MAYDFGLTPEKPSATVRFKPLASIPGGVSERRWPGTTRFARESFRCRIPEQGLWMPFAKISAVQGWEDFGFRFKEGNDETKWDDQHGILTFRYTEPMTWWMPMPQGDTADDGRSIGRSPAIGRAGRRRSQGALHQRLPRCEGRFVARLLDTPWCNGAVWSMNSMPGIARRDDRLQATSGIRRSARNSTARSGRATWTASTSTPARATLPTSWISAATISPPPPRRWSFSPDEHRPAIFRGLIAFEYVRGIEQRHPPSGQADDGQRRARPALLAGPHARRAGHGNRLAPAGQWQPMSDAELLYRRALCKGKPFCFLMNTRFETSPMSWSKST